MLSKQYINLVGSICIAFVLSVLLSYEAHSQTPTNQDCLGAIPICSNTYTVNFNHNGMGNYTNEIFNVSSCYAPEQRSVWLKFTVQQGGILRYEINPLNANQDHDWTLFNMTNATCSQLSSYTGASSAMARSNTWGTFGVNGSTGVSTPNGGSGTCNGPGNTNGPQWNADLTVTTGSTYYLHITNWTGTVYGFTIDFSSSTAVLFDNVPPAIDSITSSTACQSFDSLIVQFNEPLACNSVQSGDFSLMGPNGPLTITSAASINCVNGFSNEVLVQFSPAVSAIGTYVLNIIPGAGYVEDVCGNLDTLDSVSFVINQLIETQLDSIPLNCFGDCSGQIQLTVSGGALPLSYSWSNGLPTGTTQNQLCAGVYTVTITDNTGCVVEDSIDVTEPDDIVQSVVSSNDLSCPNTSGCDGSATVSAVGGTFPYSYYWASGSIGAFGSNLCSGLNNVVAVDAHGCIDSFDVAIGIPDEIVTSSAGDTLICIGQIASLAAASTGGTAPFTYLWFEDSSLTTILSQSQTPQVSLDTTSSFWVQATDANGCPGDTSQVTVRIRPPLGLDIPKVDTICPYDTIDIVVGGTGGDTIYTFSWSTGVFGPKATVSPDSSYLYYITVSDLCGTPPYVDSVFVQVGGYSLIDAAIRAEDDSICLGESIYLIASGRGGFKGPKEYQYKWSHTLDESPTQFVTPNSSKTYSVTITDLCLSKPGKASKFISVGKEESPFLKASPSKACAEAEVMIQNVTFDSSSTYVWTFSDETTITNFVIDNEIIAFQDTGCFDARVDVITNHGCVSSVNFPCLVEILEQPKASFSASPENPTNVHPNVVLTNTSSNFSNYTWYIRKDTISNEDRLFRIFKENGADSIVMLVAESKDGCIDTFIQSFHYVYETTLYYPSSFTPNGDGLNDVFYILGEAVGIEDFELQIYDRWGGILFESKSLSEGWDGKVNSRDYISSGTYPFVLRYRNNLGQLKVVRDQVIVSKVGNKVGLR